MALRDRSPPHYKSKFRKYYKEQEEIEQIKGVFEYFDRQNKNYLNLDECNYAIKSFGINIKKRNIRSICNQQEIDENFIDKDQFEKICIHFWNQSDKDYLDKQLFELIDQEKLGKIDFFSLKRASQKYQIETNDQELAAMIKSFDKDGDKMINFTEFQNINKSNKNI